MLLWWTVRDAQQRVQLGSAGLHSPSENSQLSEALSKVLSDSAVHTEPGVRLLPQKESDKL